jgi:preprotein translocase subunit SecE
MAKDQNLVQGAPRRRPAMAAPAAVAQSPAKKRVSLPQFLREVRAEGRKVTWTSWKETWITSVMVFFMVFITAVFFVVVDGGLGWAMQLLLNFAGKGA